ncbi:hypothetical protein [Pedobacter puniceum]|nr:hypothetical protein [Pedobacter puniceum]
MMRKIFSFKTIPSLKILTLLLILSVFSCKKKEVAKKEEAPPKEETPVTPTPTPPPANTTSLVYVATNGKLAYNTYVNQGETDKINQVPDFSNAGYGGGGVAIPAVPVVRTLSPQSGDNRARIQQVIDEVEALPVGANGFRGAILLNAGTYDIEGTLTIEASGVVLRGVGQGASGTILRATRRAQHTLIEVKGSGSGFGEISSSRRLITDSYVPTGVKSFNLENTNGLTVGDKVLVTRTPNQAWIDLLEMAQYGWTATGYNMSYERIVTAISGNNITLNAPMVEPIQTRHGGGRVGRNTVTGRIQNSGVENMRLVSVFNNDTDELHGWIGIELSRTENCWVKGVTAQYFGYACVSISDNCVFNTVEDCAMLDPKSLTDGGRKYSFNLENSASFNLFQRCFTRGGRHDFVTGSKVPGPNVFLDCVAVQTFSDIGPHHRWATGVLFDNIYGGQMRVWNRRDMGSGHGWAGAQTMFWNCRSVSSDVVVDSPAGARNWGVGVIGLRFSGTGYFESNNVHVQPRSLYLAQLKDRLGDAAVNNITIPAQRMGSISAQLQSWAGEGAFNP